MCDYKTYDDFGPTIADTLVFNVYDYKRFLRKSKLYAGYFDSSIVTIINFTSKQLLITQISIRKHCCDCKIRQFINKHPNAFMF